MEFLTAAPMESSARAGRKTVDGKAGAGCRRASLWCRGLAILILFGLGGPLPGDAAATQFEEYAVKAAYLYNFAKFVEWPPQTFPSADAPLLICIAGANPFGAALPALSDKTVESHPVEVRHLPLATDLDRCHVVFVSRAEQGRFKTLLARIARLPILTVGDVGEFARMGGMIGLVEADQRIRFEINLTATRQANLKLSSQLLKLAIIVE